MVPALWEILEARFLFPSPSSRGRAPAFILSVLKALCLLRFLMAVLYGVPLGIGSQPLSLSLFFGGGGSGTGYSISQAAPPLCRVLTLEFIACVPTAP